jgi:hypothetical protein
VVHRVLEAIVQAARPAPASEPAPAGLAAAPFAVAWPDSEGLEEALTRAAVEAVRDMGFDSPALASLLAGRARPLIERARDLDWTDGEEGSPVLPRVLGAEVEGRVTLAASEAGAPARTVRFRADRVDAQSGGEPCFTDYKTGAAFSTRKKPETRRKALLGDVSSGRRLQAAAYALASGSQPGTSGRYLQLGAESDAGALDAHISRGDDDFAEAFEHAANALLRAIEAGSFAPRLVQPAGGTSPCEFCAVKSACLRGDSGARLRMLHWENENQDAEADSDALVALRDLAALRRGHLGRPAAESGS